MFFFCAEISGYLPPYTMNPIAAPSEITAPWEVHIKYLMITLKNRAV